MMMMMMELEMLMIYEHVLTFVFLFHSVNGEVMRRYIVYFCIVNVQ